MVPRRWFWLGALVFSSLSLQRAKSVGFESEVFAPFRFEGLLFARNALAAPNAAFFFIRDWSTSPDPREHPLLYFHNLDAAHLLTGLLQCLLGEKAGLWVHFLISLSVTLAALWMGLDCARRLAPRQNFWGAAAALGVMLIHPRSLRLAPQNLWISGTSAVVLWHMSLMLRGTSGEGRGGKWELPLCLCLASLLETNLALLLFLITCAVSGLSRWRAAAAAVVLPRVLQLAAVLVYGYWSDFRWDAAFSRMVKTSATVGLEQAIAAYAGRGVTYFGDATMQSYAGNLRQLAFSLWRLSGGWAGAAILGLGLWRLRSSRKGEAAPGTLYAAAFLVCSFAMIPVSGDALWKISYSPYGFLNYKIGYSLALVLLPAGLAASRWGFASVLLSVWVLPFLTVFDLGHRDRLDFAAAARTLEPEARVITNYEPSIAAGLFGRPVAVSWFAQARSPGELAASPRLLRMYKAAREEERGPRYAFLAAYPPYFAGAWEELLSQSGLAKPDGSLRPGVTEVWRGGDYRLFRFEAVR